MHTTLILFRYFFHENFLWNKPRWYKNRCGKNHADKTSWKTRFGILHDLIPTWLHDYYTLIVHHFKTRKQQQRSNRYRIFHDSTTVTDRINIEHHPRRNDSIYLLLNHYLDQTLWTLVFDWEKQRWQNHHHLFRLSAWVCVSVSK